VSAGAWPSVARKRVEARLPAARERRRRACSDAEPEPQFPRPVPWLICCSDGDAWARELRQSSGHRCPVYLVPSPVLRSRSCGGGGPSPRCGMSSASAVAAARGSFARGPGSGLRGRSVAPSAGVPGRAVGARGGPCFRAVAGRSVRGAVPGSCWIFVLSLSRPLSLSLRLCVLPGPGCGSGAGDSGPGESGGTSPRTPLRRPGRGRPGRKEA